MRWAKACFLALGAAAVACAPRPPPARAVVAPSPPRPAPAAAPWPDVSRPARSDKSGVQDAAVVVAVERRATLPDLPGVRVSAEDWVRFFPNVLGVPPERVTALFDATATPEIVSSALRATAARLGPGGRLWFVALGYAIVDETAVAFAAARPDAQVISVLDVVPADVTQPARPAPSPIVPTALGPITFSISKPTPLPRASRPALSYLLMGALRGWGDQDRDGRVTAAEAAQYLDLTLRFLSPQGRSERNASVRTELVCSDLTTLSVAREPAPNVLEIAPRVPLGAHANAELLGSALEAVHAVDAQLARSRAAGSLQATAELSQPRFTGEGEQRRVEVVPMPPEVEATLRVRLEQAKRLGGAAVPEAAPLLVEAGRLLLAYGRLDESKQTLRSVLEARCGVDDAGHQAWQSLLAIANFSQQRQDAVRLASMTDCAYDEASATAIDALLRPIRGPDGPNERARQLYSRAEDEEGTPHSRCTWSAVAEKYGRSWWSDTEHSWQVESALNGAYAFRRLGRTGEAAALYRSYVTNQGGARTGDSERSAKDRRTYALGACASYLALAKAEPRFFPGFFDACGSFSCTNIDRSRCAEIVSSPEIPLPGLLSGEPELARKLSLAALDSEELAAWELTETARVERLRQASARYAAAEAAWAALVPRSDAIPDPAEVARRLAEAAVGRVRVDLEAGVEVTEPSVANARQLARHARDTSSDERRVEPARLLVDLADALLAREQRAFVASQGERGVASRSEVRFKGGGAGRRIVKDDVPLPVAAAIAARDEYLASVPAAFDTAHIRYRLAYEAGRLQFLYGHFAEARQRLELPYTMECGVSPVAHEAWVLLLSMANVELDMARVQALAGDAAVCASDVETRIAAERMRKPVLSIPFVVEARRQLEASQALPDGPQRRALRRQAAASFRQFVAEAPARDEAPEAARLSAELYAELGENARALEMYRQFVDRYAAEARVQVADVEKAYAALAMLHARLADYAAEARVLVEESEQTRLPAKLKAAAARKARALRKDRDGRGLLPALPR